MDLLEFIREHGFLLFVEAFVGGDEQEEFFELKGFFRACVEFEHGFDELYLAEVEEAEEFEFLLRSREKFFE